MTLQDLTSRDAVLAAIAEFDALGRHAFLRKYSFGPARGYFLVHEGRRYDSKAIVGVAIGFQHPQRGPLTSTEFSGGEATVRAKLQGLGFTVEALDDDTEASQITQPQPSLELGRVYSWEELGELFDCEPDYFGSVGGLASRPRMGALLVITHIGGAKSFNYEDYWDEDELVYTGRGKIGDQSLTGQNRLLAENRARNYVFEKAGAYRLLFHGIARCTQVWEARGEDSNGQDRRIIRFRLSFETTRTARKVELAARVSPKARRPRPARVPRTFDPMQAPAAFVAGNAHERPEETLARREKAVQEHHALVTALHRLLKSAGWSDIQEIPGAVDLWARGPLDGRRIIFEAKTIEDGNEVHQARAALSQLLEYRHFDGAPDDRLCLVTNAPISDVRERFLRTQGVAVLTFDGAAWNVAGPLAGEWLGVLVGSSHK